MPYRFMPIGANSDIEELRRVVNANFAQLDSEAVAKQFKDGNNNSMLIGVLSDGTYGIEFSDGSVTFLKITKDGIVLNDGTNDRLLLGKQEDGF